MKNLFLIVLATFVLSSCKKEVDELPEATQTGAHTLGARIKGELWVPAGFGIAPTSDILTARFDVNNSVLIQAKNFASEPLEKELEIYIKNITGTGVYQLDTDTGPYPSPSGSYAFYLERRGTPIAEWITSYQYRGQVEITRYDPANKIISGTFSFTAGVRGPYNDSPLTVTEGRFDLKII